MKTAVRPMTLNPGWFEVYSLDVDLLDWTKEELPNPGFTLTLYDDDMFGKDLIGSVYIPIEGPKGELDGYPLEMDRSDPKWTDLAYHLTGEFSGSVLIGFQLLKVIEGKELPPIQDIFPECI